MSVEVLWPRVVPVAWYATRGNHWDQTILEDVFAQRWGSTSPLVFKHFVVTEDHEWPVADGVVCVIPARHFVSSAKDINDALGRYEWAVAMLTGDEEGTFPYQELTNAVVMRQTPLIFDKGPLPEDDWWFGDGYTPHTRPTLVTPHAQHQYEHKVLDWSFAGQDTHERRHEMLRAMGKVPNGQAYPSKSFTAGVPPEQYTTLLAASKVVPCPSGPVHVDTFRVFEALEAGCVPLLDGRTPSKSMSRYWDHIFGNHPLPIVDEWMMAPLLVKQAVAEWPAPGNRCFAWWQLYKRDFAHGVVDAIEEARGINFAIPPNRHITAVVTTSPIPSHPDTKIIEATIASIRGRLPEAEIIVAFDGVRPEQEHLRAAYEEYQHRLLWMMNFEWHDVIPVRVDDWHHQALLARHALTACESPVVLFVEHDTPLVGEIPFERLCGPLWTGEANLVRLHHESSVLPDHEHMMVHSTPQLVGAESVPMLGTMQWSQRPHLARSDFYESILAEYFGEKSRTMIEDVMHGVLDQHWRTHGKQGWKDWRTYLYAPPGDMKRSTHLDGREHEPKFDMIYEYDTDRVPPGAPYPTSRR